MNFFDFFLGYFYIRATCSSFFYLINVIGVQNEIKRTLIFYFICRFVRNRSKKKSNDNISGNVSVDEIISPDFLSKEISLTCLQKILNFSIKVYTIRFNNNAST